MAECDKPPLGVFCFLSGDVVSFCKHCQQNFLLVQPPQLHTASSDRICWHGSGGTAFTIQRLIQWPTICARWRPVFLPRLSSRGRGCHGGLKLESSSEPILVVPGAHDCNTKFSISAYQKARSRILPVLLFKLLRDSGARHVGEQDT